MSTITMQAPARQADESTRSGSGAVRSNTGPPPVRPSRPTRPDRPDRGSARRSGPVARGRSGVAAPRLQPVARVQPAACRGEAVVTPVLRPVRAEVRSRVRLTNRGIAVILIAGAMVVVAALTVVGGTALRVTSDAYQPGISALAR